MALDRERRAGTSEMSLRFSAPAGPAVLVARWGDRVAPLDRRALLEDAAHSLHLALEREESERAHQEATALRRSQELHQQFLSRLSHELRTPLTAIHGYASSLMQPDVSWDRSSQDRFLSRISAESGRLARLVDDLLDFSAIESNNLRIQPDWCDLSLVLDSARGCLPPERSAHVGLPCEPRLPVVWADHDRLEQVFVNLMDNAVRHNPVGTTVEVTAASAGRDGVTVTVADDGIGVPASVAAFEPRRHTAATSGSGLGLSIAKGIVEAHGGRLELRRPPRGTAFVVHLPVEVGDLAADAVVDA
jgi:signal transduction histidine kinase